MTAAVPFAANLWGRRWRNLGAQRGPGASPCRRGRMPGRWRVASARTEDRCFSTPARAELEPDEQQRLDVDERARDLLNRPGGAGGARRKVEKAVPDGAGEDAAVRAVVEPGEHDRPAGEAENESEITGWGETAVGGDREEVRQVPDGPDRGEEQRGGERAVAALQPRQREAAPDRKSTRLNSS